jgi:predicted phage-related endonuclease
MPPLTPANHAARATRVTASEVGALMPEGHPYTTALDIWNRLTFGVQEPVQSSPAMIAGTILEPAILKLAAVRFGWDVWENGHTYTHRSAPLVATPDARIIRYHDADTMLVTPRALVEVKYSGNPTGWQQVPPHVYYQCQAQLACTSGYELVEVVVLAGHLRRFTVWRDQTAIRRITAASRRMLELVAAGTPPPQVIESATFSLPVGDKPTDRPPSLTLRLAPGGGQEGAER